MQTKKKNNSINVGHIRLMTCWQQQEAKSYSQHIWGRLREFFTTIPSINYYKTTSPGSLHNKMRFHIVLSWWTRVSGRIIILLVFIVIALPLSSTIHTKVTFLGCLALDSSIKIIQHYLSILLKTKGYEWRGCLAHSLLKSKQFFIVGTSENNHKL